MIYFYIYIKKAIFLFFNTTSLILTFMKTSFSVVSVFRPPIHSHASVRVHVGVQEGICASWHVCPQHGAAAAPVPASWRLNLLRGSAAQLWEAGRTHNDAPDHLPRASTLTGTCRLAASARD